MGGINCAKLVFEESTQSTSGKGHEKSKVQTTDLKGLQTSYLGHPHALELQDTRYIKYVEQK